MMNDPRHNQPRQGDIFCFAALKTKNMPLPGGVGGKMKFCPRCNTKGISVRKLVSSDPASPCRCSSCGNMFFMPGGYRNVLELTPHLLIPFVLIGALVIPSWWPIVIFVTLLPCLYALAAYICTPVHTSKEEVQKSQHYQGIIQYILLAVLIGGILWFLL